MQRPYEVGERFLVVVPGIPFLLYTITMQDYQIFYYSYLMRHDIKHSQKRSLSMLLDSKNQNQNRTPRILSIDILRGLVMVLMVLDHVRMFFSNANFNPLDLTQTNIPLFLTRWITHLCAPTFIFLAGIGAYVSLKRGKTKQQLCRFLLLRGCWFIFLDLTVVRFSWRFDLSHIFSAGGGVVGDRLVDDFFGSNNLSSYSDNFSDRNFPNSRT